jgi:putative FmdB family regulatory protein
MPIYEFYCAHCNTLLSFFSSRIRTDAAPTCPHCGRPELPRRPSTFATPKSRGESADAAGDDDLGPLGNLDEGRLEQAMSALESEVGDADSDDPRQMARFFRRFSELSGLAAGPRMEDLLHRLEAGEDPDSLEDELGGDEGGDEDLSDFFQVQKAAKARRQARPRVDPTLYFM